MCYYYNSNISNSNNDDINNINNSNNIDNININNNNNDNDSYSPKNSVFIKTCSVQKRFDVAIITDLRKIT